MEHSYKMKPSLFHTPFLNQNQASRDQPYLNKDTFGVPSPSLHANSVASTCDQCGVDVPYNLDEV